MTRRKISPSVAPKLRATRTNRGLVCTIPSYITITPEKNEA